MSMNDMLYTQLKSPIGTLLLCGDEARLTGLYTAPRRRSDLARDARRAEAPFAHVREQLEQYFAGERFAFDVPLALDGGSTFFQSVWRELLEIPYGATATYGELARKLGKSAAAARAVGAANARNPIAIIVPCHRVIGSTGDLTGYAGGLERKRFLLDHEAAIVRPKMAVG